jgi:hypothetical protein
VLADLSAYKTGVPSPNHSEGHMRSLQWLMRRNRARRRPGPPLESQKFAGWLDGPFGVVYALEAALRDQYRSEATPQSLGVTSRYWTARTSASLPLHLRTNNLARLLGPASGRFRVAGPTRYLEGFALVYMGAAASPRVNWYLNPPVKSQPCILSPVR